MSANEAETLTLPATATPADAVMSSKLAAAEILPELVATDLADEVDVEEAVAVDVGHRDPGPVIVVRRLVGLPGVVHDAVLECDAALGQAIRELEIVEGGEPGRRFDLRGRLLLEPLGGLEIGRDVTDRDFLSGHAEAEDGEHRHSHHNPSSHVAISVKSRSIDRERAQRLGPLGAPARRMLSAVMTPSSLCTSALLTTGNKPPLCHSRSSTTSTG